jgi:hypothetical protein
MLLLSHLDIEDVAGALFLLAPLVLGIASYWPSARGHWTGPLLAAPALLLGLAVAGAVVTATSAWMLLPALPFFPMPLMLGIGSIALWLRRRSGR